MALVGNMIHDAFAGDPPIINYTMFLAVISMLALFYLIPATFNDSFAFHPLLMVGLDLLLTVLFFCGAVALAAYLGVHSCHNDNYTKNNFITNGSHNRYKRCTEAQAVTAFYWFGFAAFATSTVLSGIQSRGGSTGGSSFRRSGPSMSQV